MVGCLLCRCYADGRVERLVLTETEAYDGPKDRACHAHKGKTPRTEVMFGSAGHFYIYLCYGMHWMLNVVTGPEEYPAAVLIRGLHGVSGPGRLTRRLEIDKTFNRLPAEPGSGLWLEGPARLPPQARIRALPRIGINYAGAEWAAKPYRFVLDTK